MPILPAVFIGLVALIYVAISFAEMFLWIPKKSHKGFAKLALTDDEAKKVAPIVANAGLYNLFIAGGLIFS